jgi:hypothetical protein
MDILRSICMYASNIGAVQIDINTIIDISSIYSLSIRFCNKLVDPTSTYIFPLSTLQYPYPILSVSPSPRKLILNPNPFPNPAFPNWPSTTKTPSHHAGKRPPSRHPHAKASYQKYNAQLSPPHPAIYNHAHPPCATSSTHYKYTAAQPTAQQSLQIGAPGLGRLRCRTL